MEENRQCKQCAEKYPVAFILVAVVVVLAFLIYPGSDCKEALSPDQEAFSDAECFATEQAVISPPPQASINLPEGVEPITFPTGTVTIHTKDASFTIQAELATTEKQLTRGFMYRSSLDADKGMLFIFPWEQDGGFWMYNMRFPLSIAFMNDQGIILEIVDMEPCLSPYAIVCDMDAYYPKQPYRYALEMNKGYFVRNNIKKGDKVSYTSH